MENRCLEVLPNCSTTESPLRLSHTNWKFLTELSVTRPCKHHHHEQHHAKLHRPVDTYDIQHSTWKLSTWPPWASSHLGFLLRRSSNLPDSESQSQTQALLEAITATYPVVSSLSTCASMESSSVSGCQAVELPLELTAGTHDTIWEGPSLSNSNLISPSSCHGKCKPIRQEIIGYRCGDG